MSLGSPIAALSLASVSALALGLGAQRPTFRAFTDVVSVDVSVKDGRVPVGGLTATDFELRDNGVAQAIDSVSIEVVPIDVTLVVDLSSSVVPNIKAFKSDVEQFVAMLRPTERVRIVSFATDVREDVTMKAPGGRAEIEWANGGSTSLNDALLYGLLWPETPDRRHLVIVFTDGRDTFSIVPSESVPAVAGRIETVLHAVLVESSESSSEFFRDSLDALREAVFRTGGEVHRLSKALDDFNQIVADFRASYVLRYTPKGVERPGWHALTVKVTRPGRFTVRARAGYTGG
jgi:hypothetical protein